MEVDYTVHLENICLMARGILNSCPYLIQYNTVLYNLLI
jgi:hypothetical protein